MLMQVGQFLDHDMSRTAISKLATNARGQHRLTIVSFITWREELRFANVLDVVTYNKTHHTLSSAVFYRATKVLEPYSGQIGPDDVV